MWKESQPMSQFIKNASGRFIGNKYMFEFIQTNPTDDFIVLSKEMEEEYFERLVDDLKQGDIYSTLHNKQLVHESFRKRLIAYFNSNAEGVHDLFREIDKNGIKLVTGERHCDWYDIYDSDDDDEITEDDVTNYISVDRSSYRGVCGYSRIPYQNGLQGQ